jgi:uncharacterized protein (TIGR00661 family)
MNYLFLIQGEGRGHMTQAISLSEALEEKGHTISEVWIGISPHRKLPPFVTEYFAAKIKLFRSPNFLPNKNKKGINLIDSFFYNLLRTPVYIKEMIRLARVIKSSKADCIINFYEALGNIAYNLSFSSKPSFSIAHQYFLNHKDFKKPVGNQIQWQLLKMLSALTSFGSTKKLALSFTETADISKKKLIIVPPLLRKSIYTTNVTNQGFILVYILNPGFLNEISNWCQDNPKMHVTAFTDNPSLITNPPDNLKINPINGKSFMEALAACSTVICTAGFETVSEAAFLGKRIFLIPSENHFEQACNAVDAERAGIATYSDKFNSVGLSQPIQATANLHSLKLWFNKNPDKIIDIITHF